MSNNSVALVTPSDLWDIFFWGAGYGQLLMEEERENEEIFDAAGCAHFARKRNVPSIPVRRRQIHSEKWFEAKREGYREFIQFYKNYAETFRGNYEERKNTRTKRS